MLSNKPTMSPVLTSNPKTAGLLGFKGGGGKGRGSGTGGPPPATNHAASLLLEDNVSYILLEDNLSSILLE